MECILTEETMAIKKRITKAKTEVLYWKRSFKNEVLHLKLYLSDEWVKEFGEDGAALAAKRVAYAWSELKKYENEVEDLEHELSEQIE